MTTLAVALQALPLGQALGLSAVARKHYRRLSSVARSFQKLMSVYRSYDILIFLIVLLECVDILNFLLPSQLNIFPATFFIKNMIFSNCSLLDILFVIFI